MNRIFITLILAALTALAASAQPVESAEFAAAMGVTMGGRSFASGGRITQYALRGTNRPSQTQPNNESVYAEE